MLSINHCHIRHCTKTVCEFHSFFIIHRINLIPSISPTMCIISSRCECNLFHSRKKYFCWLPLTIWFLCIEFIYYFTHFWKTKQNKLYNNLTFHNSIHVNLFVPDIFGCGVASVIDMLRMFLGGNNKVILINWPCAVPDVKFAPFEYPNLDLLCMYRYLWYHTLHLNQ